MLRLTTVNGNFWKPPVWQRHVIHVQQTYFASLGSKFPRLVSVTKTTMQTMQTHWQQTSSNHLNYQWPCDNKHQQTKTAKTHQRTSRMLVSTSKCGDSWFQFADQKWFDAIDAHMSVHVSTAGVWFHVMGSWKGLEQKDLKARHEISMFDVSPCWFSIQSTCVCSLMFLVSLFPCCMFCAAWEPHMPCTAPCLIISGQRGPFRLMASMWSLALRARQSSNKRFGNDMNIWNW